MPSVTIELNADDEAMLHRIHELTETLRRAPRRREVVRHDGHNFDHEKHQQSVFERLKVLGLVGHAADGHCWTTEAAKALAL